VTRSLVTGRAGFQYWPHRQASCSYRCGVSATITRCTRAAVLQRALCWRPLLPQPLHRPRKADRAANAQPLRGSLRNVEMKEAYCGSKKDLYYWHAWWLYFRQSLCLVQERTSTMSRPALFEGKKSFCAGGEGKKRFLYLSTVRPRCQTTVNGPARVGKTVGRGVEV
jgi:hypothetical protein